MRFGRGGDFRAMSALKGAICCLQKKGQGVLTVAIRDNPT